MGNRIRRCGIYIITCTETMKVYIGSSVYIGKRLDRHKYNLRRGIHQNSYLQNEWNKYGEDKFTFAILEQFHNQINREDLEKKETEYIFRYNSHKKERGFNLTLPGTIPLTKEDENESGIGKALAVMQRTKPVIVINSTTKECVEFESYSKAGEFLGLHKRKIADLVLYWVKKSHKRSYKGFFCVRKEDYDPDFDYYNWFRNESWIKERPKLKRTGDVL